MTVSELLETVGATALSAGLFMLAPWLGVTVAGGLLIAAGIALDR